MDTRTPGLEIEPRRITALFADISGFTRRVEKANLAETYPLVMGLRRLLAEVVEKHGGTVEKPVGDAVLAVFGLPLTLEASATSAVNAAIEMQRRVAEFGRDRGLSDPLRIHVGICTGQVVSGDPAEAGTRDFVVLGDPVNVASRLSDEAPPGHVYVGPETHRYTRDRFAYRPLGRIRLKGREQRIAVFDLLSSHERLFPERGAAGRSLFPELVGRDSAVQAVRERLAQVARGMGGVVTIAGPAGVGKTRLLDELSRTPESEPARWLAARSAPIGRSLSFHVVADLLRGWAGIDETASDEEARARLRSAAAELEAPAEAETILANLVALPLAPGERQRLDRIQDEAMSRTILRVVTQLLQGLAQQGPVVIAVEDLHWADASSLQLLGSLCVLTEELPLLILETLRPAAGPGDEAIALLPGDRVSRHLRLELAPLDHASTRRLLRSAIREGAVPSELLARLETKAAGNPFFLEEAIRSLIEAGALGEDAAGLHAREAAPEIALPDTVHEVVMGRIDRLPSQARRALQVASVIGVVFHDAALRDVMPDTIDLDAQLDVLERAHMIERCGEEGGQHRFTHPLVQEVAYESIVEPAREAMHAKVGHAIESRLSERLPGFHGMLAYHFTRGGELERAEEHLFRAGDEAARLAASDEALHFFQQAALVYGRSRERIDPARMAELERRIARAHLNRGEQTEAIDHLDRALELLGERVPRSTPGLVAQSTRSLLSAGWALLRAGATASRPPADGVQQAVIELMFDRARAQTTTAPARFFLDGLTTFRKLRAVDPTSVPGSGGMHAGMVGPLAYGGLSFRASRRFLELSRPLVREDDVPEFFLFRLMEFLHETLAGEWDGPEIEPERVREALDLGVIWDVTNYLGLLSERTIARGEFARAEALIEEIGRIAKLYQYDLAWSTFRAQRSFLYLERRQLPEAIRAADEYFTEHQEPMLNVLALGTKAKAEMLAGLSDGARTTLRTAARILSQARIMPPLQASAYWRSRLWLRLGDLEAALADEDRGIARVARRTSRVAARQAVRLAARVAVRRPEVYRLEGRRHWLEDNRQRAQGWWSRSLESAETLGMAPEAARTRACIGLHLRSTGDPKAGAWLEEAEKEFRRLGLVWDLDQLERGLAERSGP